MDNKPKMELTNLMLQNYLSKFIDAYQKNGDVLSVYEKLLSLLGKDNNSESSINRKIFERCRDLFKDKSLKNSLDAEILRSKNEFRSNSGKEPSSTDISKSILVTFSDYILGDDKRKYNMSQLASKGVAELAPNIVYNSIENYPNNVEKVLTDSKGDSISIKCIGRLVYGKNGEYLYKYRITHKPAPVNQSEVKETIYEKYADITLDSLDGLDKREYRAVVFSELLNKRNIEFSFADDYIGGIHPTPEGVSSLKVGEESFEKGGFYQYQVTPSYRLTYDATHIEAVRAYKQQEFKKQKETGSR